MRIPISISYVVAALAPLAIAASAQQTPPQRLAAVAITADVETNRTTNLADGNTLKRAVVAKYFRDADGRTRFEQGRTASISDPVGHFAITIDIQNRTAIRVALPAPPQPAPGTGRVGANGGNPAPPHTVTELGPRVIEGIPTMGKRYVITIPPGSAIGNEKPVEKVAEIWHSAELQLPVLVVLNDPVSGTLTTAYRNVKSGVTLDRKLFEIPEGFTITEHSGALAAQTAVRP